MSTYVWDPFAALERFDREFDSMVRGSFGSWGRPRALRALGPSPRPASNGRTAEVATRAARFGAVASFGAVVPPADVVTAGEDVVINLELPGVDVEKDVVVEIDRGRLVVRGERGGSSETSEGG